MVAAGLAWSVISKSGVARKKDIKKACAESGLSFGIVVDGIEDSALGLCPKKVDHPSAAAMLAAANVKALKDRAFGDSDSNSSWIVIEKITSGERAGSYWLCAIADGLPVPGTDVVEDLAVISAKLAELIDILDNVDLYSPDREIQEYVEGVTTAMNKGFAELTAEVSLPKGGRPQKIVGVPDTVYMGVAALAVLLIGGVGATWYVDYQATEEKAKKAASARLAKKRIAEQSAAEQSADYRKRVAEAERKAMEKLAGALRVKPGSMALAWGQALDTLPSNHGGWEVVSADCVETSCKIALKRLEKLGTNEALLEIVPAAMISNNDATYQLEIAPLESQGVQLSDLGTFANFEREPKTQLQMMTWSGIEAKPGAVKEITFTPPPPPVAKGEKDDKKSAMDKSGKPRGAAPKSLGYASGLLTVGGSHVWQIAKLEELLDAKEISFETLKVEFNGGAGGGGAWRITGRYYVKSGANAATPMGPGGPALMPGQIPPGVGAQPPQNQPMSAMPAMGPQAPR